VVKATADKNEDFLLKTLDTDEGARYVGEFAIGTNKGITRFTREILFDEKINGTFHMALGRSIPESRGKNESAIHWDMVCDLREGGEIWVDDLLLYQNGEFVIEFLEHGRPNGSATWPAPARSSAAESGPGFGGRR
jgi:aminopeptidase